MKTEDMDAVDAGMTSLLNQYISKISDDGCVQHVSH